jgi:deazaflavin-dependent oxidoreductase (nitroreductase family)
VSDATSNHAADVGRSQPEDRVSVAGSAHSHERGTARQAREYRMSRADQVGNAIFNVLTWIGVGPCHLLTARGRKTGRPRTNPVILVQQNDQRWLVSPYGAVPWVLNARAAQRVSLRRGRHRQDYTIREVSAEEAGPVLKRYVAVASATRPYFQAGKNAPVADFIAEAHRHPVFALTPIDEDSDKGRS